MPAAEQSLRGGATDAVWGDPLAGGWAVSARLRGVAVAPLDQALGYCRTNARSGMHGWAVYYGIVRMRRRVTYFTS